jgi:hypothetical protein
MHNDHDVKGSREGLGAYLPRCTVGGSSSCQGNFFRRNFTEISEISLFSVTPEKNPMPGKIFSQIWLPAQITRQKAHKLDSRRLAHHIPLDGAPQTLNPLISLQIGLQSSRPTARRGLPPPRQLTDGPAQLAGASDPGLRRAPVRDSAWLAAHPEVQAQLAAGRPSVLVVTGSAPAPCP